MGIKMLFAFNPLKFRINMINGKIRYLIGFSSSQISNKLQAKIII